MGWDEVRGLPGDARRVRGKVPHDLVRPARLADALQSVGVEISDRVLRRNYTGPRARHALPRYGDAGQFVKVSEAVRIILEARDARGTDAVDFPVVVCPLCGERAAEDEDTEGTGKRRCVGCGVVYGVPEVA